MNYIEQDELAAAQKAEREKRLDIPKANYPKDIYDTAIEHYGAIAQTIKAIEEMSELMKELCKALALEVDNDHISEEIGDVEIMLEQMKRIYTDDCAVSRWKVKKIQRLRERMEGNDKN